MGVKIRFFLISILIISLSCRKDDNNPIAIEEADRTEQQVIDNDLAKNQFVIDKIKDNFDLSPRGIREMLGLNKPIYEKSAAYGHVGREPEADWSFSCEKTDKKSIFSK